MCAPRSWSAGGLAWPDHGSAPSPVTIATIPHWRHETLPKTRPRRRDHGIGRTAGGVGMEKTSGGIDGATLERLERIARGLPGRTVAAAAPDEADEARISVDGIDASDLIDHMVE